MYLNNSFNILPWYDSLAKRSSQKWYAFGQSWPLLCPKGRILPFQFVCEKIEILSTVFAVDVKTGTATDLKVTPTVVLSTQADATYYVVKMPSTQVIELPVGLYYLRFNTSLGYLYSEEISIIDDAEECVKIEYWNEDTLKFTSGEINFEDNFKFELYLRTTIGKPEYEFEEELTKRLGYKFIESQTSNKLYKFAFVAPEYICDAMRLIRLCDYIKITTKFDSYNALSFAYEPKWQEQGDLAAVDAEFDTDCIIQKLESFNRRLRESFYNALLAEIDEPVLFSTDTVAQYYTEFTSTSYINGKLIRQLESMPISELRDSLADIVLPTDNQSDNRQAAKKVFLSDILSLVETISNYFKPHYGSDGQLEWIEALAHIGVRGGVNMYIDGGNLNLPSIYDSLPIDWKTLIRDANGVLMVNPDIELGGGGITTWDELQGKPSWIGSSKPVYNYSEIQGTPDLSKYIPIAGVTDITGEKNFVGGLKVNGSPIYYDTEKKYWKLEGDLLVTGGVIMYGNDSDFVASTIMDAIAVDGTTISKEGGILKVIGSVGGATTLGSLANVGSWADSVASQDRIMYQAANSSQWVAKNLSDLAVGGVTGNYLPLSGGTLTNTLTIDNSTVGLILHRSGQKTPYIRFGQDANNEWGELGVYNDGRLVFWPLVSSQGGYGQWNTVWHSGNDGSGSGLDADLLDGLDSSAFFCDKGASNSFDDKIYNGAYRTSSFKPNDAYGYGLVASFRSMETCAQIYFPDRNGEPQFRMQWNSQTSITSGWTALITSGSIGNYNAGSATRIQAYQHNSGENILISGTRTDNTFPRYIYDNGWGLCLRWQDGNGVVHNGTIATLNDNVASATKLATPRTIWGQSFDGTGNVSGFLQNANFIMSNNEDGYFVGNRKDGVGSSDGGLLLFSYGNNPMSFFTNSLERMRITPTGNVGIGTTNPAYKLDVFGSNNWTGNFRTNNSAVSMAHSGAYGLFVGTTSTSSDIYALRVCASLTGANPLFDVKANGNVGIGTTTPSYKLDIVGHCRSEFMYFFNKDWNGNAGYIGRGSSGNNRIILYAASDDVYLYSKGVLSTVFTGANMLVQGGITMYSARKLKNIQDERGLSLEELSVIKPTRFTWKDGRDNKIHIGGIADDVQKVLPEVIYKADNDTLTMDYGNAAFAIAASLIKPVISHEERIKVLEEENKRLKEEVEQLKWNIA